MTTEFDRIVEDDDHLGGTARIEGTRVPVDVLAALHRDGLTEEDIRGFYPQLEPGDVAQAVAYVKSLADRPSDGGNER